MTASISLSFDIVGLITKQRDEDGKETSSSENEKGSSNRRRRKVVERTGAILEMNDSLFGDHELDRDDESDDADFTPVNIKVDCICKKNFKNTFMVCCSTCKSNYHGNCIGIDRSYYEAFSQAGDVWLCPICASLDTGKDIDFFLSKNAKMEQDNKSPSPHSPKSLKDASANTNTKKGQEELKKEEIHISNEVSIQPINITEELNDTDSNVTIKKPVVSVIQFDENDILSRLSAPLPNDTTSCGEFHLFSNPNYIPKLNECISLICKAKKNEIPFCYSPPSPDDVKGGYIYVFKSENDLIENTTNEGEWSVGDGLLFTNLVLKKFPVSSSKISIIERLETNSNSNFKRRAVWLSSDPSSIVVNYIGTKGAVEDKSVELIVLDNEKDEGLSMDNTVNVPQTSPSTSKTLLLSLPPGISVIPQKSVSNSNVTPKKQIIEVVDILSDDDDNTQKDTGSAQKKRKKRLQYTPKRTEMPNLPPKQCEFLKYRRKICDETPEKDESERNKVPPLKISRVQSLLKIGEIEESS